MQPEWVKSSVFYQIFPERFANANASINPNPVESWDKSPTRDNFFGGDLQGISKHLPYIADMGINALYLTPIFQADTNHRYDATIISKLILDLAMTQILMNLLNVLMNCRFV